jgi:dynein heavy chain 1, cytosolic
VRELDFVLEQCQRGSSIPSITLPVPTSLAELGKDISPETLRMYFERYNPSQVDNFFSSIHLSMGDTEAKKEEFANEVNKIAKLWPSEIKRQTSLINSAFAGTVEKEINFWKEIDRKLLETKEQMDSSSILLTKLVLKRTVRVSEQLIQEAETSLDRSLKVVNVSLTFLRDFPIDELQAANNLTPKLSRAITNALGHFSKLKHSQYDYHRASRLLEVLGSEIVNKMISILEEKKIMHIEMNEFNNIKSQCDEVFHTWGTNLATQRTTLRDIARRRNVSFVNLTFEFDSLKDRINAIFTFRQQHDHMLTVLASIITGNEYDFISELSEAYQMVIKTNSDLFDRSSTGLATWNSSIQQYERKLEKIEERIIRILEERLHEAKTADEMFRIFSLFNPLFFRPAVRNAVNSFRTTLMKSVREDVKKLQDKFRLRYDESHEKITAELRDIPPLSGRIIWARQIENQLMMLMKRIQDVLGVGWEDHVEGKQLKDVCDELRGYLDTHQIYDEWITTQIKTDHSKYSKVKDFLLLVDIDPRTTLKMLRLNFDEKQIMIYKEVKYLEWLLPSLNVAQKTIPTTIRTRATEAYNRYPIALALESALISYHNANNKININNVPLLINHVEVVRDLFNEAIGGSKRSGWIRWDSNNLNEWVSHLVSKIYNLQERVDEVNDRLKVIDSFVQELSTCNYDRATMETILSNIQSVVDELPSKGLSNVVPWVQQLDQRLEKVLSDRLKSAITLWANVFSSDFNSGVTDGFVEMKTSSYPRFSPASPIRGSSLFSPMKESQPNEESATSTITLNPSYHEIGVSNQLLYVQPTLESTKRYWIAEYHEFIAVICTLPRISALRFQVFAESNQTKVDYTNIMKNIEVEVLQLPYIAIEKKIVAAKAYLQEWLQYQALWDASITTIADRLGRCLSDWRKFLTDIKLARSTIDTEQDEKSFGPVVINHRQAQNKINLKYDTWQREAQTRFSVILLEDIRTLHIDLIAVKSRLEAISFEGSTKDAIVGVHYITQIKDSVILYDEKINELKASEKLLQSQRFNFPAEWLPVSNVIGVFSDLTDILDRRTAVMNAQLPSLQQKIKEEDVSIQNRMEKFLESWNLSKPIEGNVAAASALESLSMFSMQLGKISDDAKRLKAAKESLRIDFITDDRLNFVEVEISDLREAWSAIAPIAEKLQILGSGPMKEANPPRIRKSLEDLINEIKQVPVKLRSYSAVETVLEKLQKYLGFQPLLRDLSTEALKDRHWKQLLEKIGLSVSWKALTIGNIWESNAMVHRKIIGEILSTAQGELALEQFLHDLRDHWVSREILIANRDGAKIVTGWEGLFTTLEDNLNSLASLKQSPYFRNVPEFQEDAMNWEGRLTNLRGIFDIWVEVQRKWLYLRGIFKNSDIKAQLPAQYTKFKSIDNEYNSLMKRMSVKPVALEVLQVENLHRQLEREDTTMSLIQKALGEYLEGQRQIFPVSYYDYRAI